MTVAVHKRGRLECVSSWKMGEVKGGQNKVAVEGVGTAVVPAILIVQVVFTVKSG